jgi:hypothetical protein
MISSSTINSMPSTTSSSTSVVAASSSSSSSPSTSASSATSISLTSSAAPPVRSSPVPIQSASAKSNSSVVPPRRPRGRTSDLAGHLLLGARQQLPPLPIAMQRDFCFDRVSASVAVPHAAASSTCAIASTKTSETRRRELLSVLSTENLLKLAQAHQCEEDAGHAARAADHARWPNSAPSAAPLPTFPGASAPLHHQLGGSLPTYGFDRDDDDDDDDDDVGALVGSAPTAAAVAADLAASARTREELECSLCFRLFYQVWAGKRFRFLSLTPHPSR